jgi:hypothetical protein
VCIARGGFVKKIWEDELTSSIHPQIPGALPKKYSERSENTTDFSTNALEKAATRTKRVPDVGFLLEFPLFCDDSAVLIVRTSGEPVSHRLGWILVEYTELTDTCRRLHRPPRDTGFFRRSVLILGWFWPHLWIAS